MILMIHLWAFVLTNECGTTTVRYGGACFSRAERFIIYLYRAKERVSFRIQCGDRDFFLGKFPDVIK